MSINNFNHIKKMEKLLKFQNKLSPSIPITSMATELARTQELFAAGTGIVDKLNTYSQISASLSSAIEATTLTRIQELTLGTSIAEYNQTSIFTSSVIKSYSNAIPKFVKDYQSFQDKINLINSFDKLKYKINISHPKSVLETNNFYRFLQGLQGEYTEEDIQNFEENISEISSTFDFELENLISEDDFKLPDVNFYYKQIICLFIVVFTSVSSDIIENSKKILNYLIYKLPENKEINAIKFYGELIILLIGIIQFLKTPK